MPDTKWTKEDAAAFVDGVSGSQELAWAVKDATEAREQRDALKQELRATQQRLYRFYELLGVDGDDPRAVRELRDDLQGFKRYKSRSRGNAQPRSGEEAEVGTPEHYEAKLATKRAEIRNLNKRNTYLAEIAKLASTSPNGAEYHRMVELAKVATS